MNSIAIGALGVTTKNASVSGSPAHGPVGHGAVVMGWPQAPGNGAPMGIIMAPDGTMLSHPLLGLGRFTWAMTASTSTAVRRRDITRDVTRTKSNWSSIAQREGDPSAGR